MTELTAVKETKQPLANQAILMIKKVFETAKFITVQRSNFTQGRHRV